MANYHSRNIFIQCMILLFFMSAFPADISAQPRTGIMLREGVILNKQQSEIFFVGPDQELRSISLKNGEVVWETNDKLKPLAIFNGKLLGQEITRTEQNNFLLKTIDIATKGKVIGKDSIFLPDNVNVDLLQKATSLFSTQSKWIENELYILWEYQKRKPLRGIRTSVETAFDSEVETGVIKVAPGFTSAMQLEKSLAPSALDQKIVASDLEKLAGMPPSQFLSADKQHILISEKRNLDTSFLKYRWRFYERNGKLLGEIKDYRSYASFVIVGDTLIYEKGPYLRKSAEGVHKEPLQIVAIHLTSNRQLWKREIFDNINQVSIPPGKRK